MTHSLPAGFTVLRGQTQKNVNHTVLTQLLNTFPTDAALAVLDLPCGNLEFLTYLSALFPAARLTGADLVPPRTISAGIEFIEMDLTRNFPLPARPMFDLITSISGVMMFGNTLSFVQNCVARLKPEGTFIMTNDNSATIMDRLAYLFLARHRLFNSVFEDEETLTEHVPIQSLCRLLRQQGIVIDNIEYTSFYRKDLLFLPIALLVYPLQWLHLRRLNTKLPRKLTQLMYPFRHLFGKHYIITGHKAAS